MAAIFTVGVISLVITLAVSIRPTADSLPGPAFGAAPPSVAPQRARCHRPPCRPRRRPPRRCQRRWCPRPRRPSRPMWPRPRRPRRRFPGTPWCRPPLQKRPSLLQLHPRPPTRRPPACCRRARQPADRLSAGVRPGRTAPGPGTRRPTDPDRVMASNRRSPSSLESWGSARPRSIADPTGGSSPDGRRDLAMRRVAAGVGRHRGCGREADDVV